MCICGSTWVFASVRKIRRHPQHNRSECTLRPKIIQPPVSIIHFSQDSVVIKALLILFPWLKTFSLQHTSHIPTLSHEAFPAAPRPTDLSFLWSPTHFNKQFPQQIFVKYLFWASLQLNLSGLLTKHFYVSPSLFSQIINKLVTGPGFLPGLSQLWVCQHWINTYLIDVVLSPLWGPNLLAAPSELDWRLPNWMEKVELPPEEIQMDSPQLC